MSEMGKLNGGERRVECQRSLEPEKWLTQATDIKTQCTIGPLSPERISIEPFSSSAMSLHWDETRKKKHVPSEMLAFTVNVGRRQLCLESGALVDCMNG